ncbi:MAG: hypothetical protein IKF78_11775 [Atopobiaceae bacterium]|nr:hypothetical protein [Atopobiaceae bacterium]
MKQSFGGGLPRLALSLVATLAIATVVGLIPGMVSTALAEPESRLFNKTYTYLNGSVSGDTEFTATNVEWDSTEGAAKFTGNGRGTSNILINKNLFSGAVDLSRGFEVSFEARAATDCPDYARFIDIFDSSSNNYFAFFAKSGSYHGYIPLYLECRYGGPNQQIHNGNPSENITDWHTYKITVINDKTVVYKDGNVHAQANNGDVIKNTLKSIGSYDQFYVGKSAFAQDSDYRGWMRNLTFSVWVNMCNVSLTGGNHATTSGGSTNQVDLTDAMATVTYTADDKCYFEEFEDITSNGVTVHRVDEATVEVSGTPTGDVELVVPDAVALPAAEVTKKPTANSLTYTGKPQELVTLGVSDGGTMQYSLDGESFSEEIPTATEPGTYTVWYKAVGDDEHSDSKAESVNVTIAGSSGAIRPAGTGHVEGIGDKAATPSGDGVLLGTTGKGKRLEAISLSLPTGSVGGIEYRAHVQNAGWGGWAADGAVCGTSGKGLRMEAVQVRLTGGLANTHSVWYRAHVQNLGTLGWSRDARDGATVGTAGRGLRLEALEVCVLPKGQVPDGYSEGKASFVASLGGRSHSQNLGWQPARGTSLGTTGRGLRLEALSLAAPALPEACGIAYEAHVQNVGWQGERADGRVAGTTGRSLRMEAVMIRLTGEASASYSVWYRVHSQNYGWLGWAKDGADAGTTGLGIRAEAVDVQVLPTGQVPAGYDASRAALRTR